MEYKATDFQFKKESIHCDGMSMPCSASCNVPFEVLESIDTTFSIKKLPGNRFIFEGRDYERIFDELYQAYYPYILKQLSQIGFKGIEECIEDEGAQSIALRVRLSKDDVKKINDGTFDNWSIINGSYQIHTPMADSFTDLDMIEEEFGNTIPKAFYEDYLEEDFEINLDEILNREINEGIIYKLSHLTEIEKEILSNTTIGNDGFAVLTICNRADMILDNCSKGFNMDIPLKSINFIEELYIEVSGMELKGPNFFAFSQKDLFKIKQAISKIENPAFKKEAIKAFEKNDGVKELGNIIATDDLYEINYDNVDADDIFMNNLIKQYERIFEFQDRNRHESDGTFWATAGYTTTYICIKQNPQNADYKQLILTTRESGKADYYFMTENENTMVAVFALWAYWGSNLENKRQKIKGILFRPFNLYYLYKR